HTFSNDLLTGYGPASACAPGFSPPGTAPTPRVRRRRRPPRPPRPSPAAGAPTLAALACTAAASSRPSTPPASAAVLPPAIDLAFDSNHVVYVADLFRAGGTSIPISVSTDHGATFSSMTLVAPNAGPFDYDRHWIATTGAGHLVVIAHNENTGNEDAWTSTDG